ncbi:MAG: hypothetical protein ACI8TX_001963 [Hyphomicrobiaceae bacterium]|jgi:hypothetical protein
MLARLPFTIASFLAVLAVGFLRPVAAEADLSPFATLTGDLSISVDATGGVANPLEIDVGKPNEASTVAAAWLLSASTPLASEDDVTDGSVTLDGNSITWGNAFDLTAPFGTFFNRMADVTAIVAPKVDAAPSGTVTFEITERTNSGATTDKIDGEVLVVVFDDPEADEETTIILLFGGQEVNGDRFSIMTTEPLDPGRVGAIAAMGLGIGFGEQGNEQASLIDVNGVRMTSSAGGSDDGSPVNGALITAGGLGDTIGNPASADAAPVGSRSDDELYDLLPFVTFGENTIVVDTINPSFDDNIFFGYFVLSGVAVLSEGLVLGPETAINPIFTSHTVTALATDSRGRAINGRLVGFRVTSGPNRGSAGVCDPGDCRTGDNGRVTFTYVSEGVEGEDSIAAFADINENGAVDVGDSLQIVSKTWIDDGSGGTTTTLPIDGCFGDCGDPTGNGRISAPDAQVTLNTAVGLFECGLCLCDVDDDGEVDAIDAMLILQRGVGLPVRLNCPPEG